MRLLKIVSILGYLAIGVVRATDSCDGIVCDATSTNEVCTPDADTPAQWHCGCKANFHFGTTDVRQTTDQLECAATDDPCVADTCKSDSTTGVCTRDTDDGAKFSCACLPNFHFGTTDVRTTTDSGECAATTDPCAANPCDADSTKGACVRDTDDGAKYSCECKEGFHFGADKATSTSTGTCEETTPCSNITCGDNTEGDCVVGEGDDYHCTCKQDFHFGAEGALKTTNELACVATPNPCTPSGGDAIVCDDASTTGACTQFNSSYQCTCKANFHFGKNSENNRKTTDSLECVADDNCTGKTCDADSTRGGCAVTDEGYECTCRDAYHFAKGEEKLRKTADSETCALTPVPKTVSVSGSVQTKLACVGEEAADITAFKDARKIEIDTQINAAINDADENAAFKGVTAKITETTIEDPTCEEVEEAVADPAERRRRRSTSKKAAFEFSVDVEYDSAGGAKGSDLGKALKAKVQAIEGASKVTYNSANLMKFGFAILAVILLR